MSFIPIRCFTCGKVIAGKWEQYKIDIQSMPKKDALNKAQLTRICCRRMFLGHVDIAEEEINYSMPPNRLKDKSCHESEAPLV